MTRVFQPHIITDDSAVGGHIIPGSLISDGDVFFSRTYSAETRSNDISKQVELFYWGNPICDKLLSDMV